MIIMALTDFVDAMSTLEKMGVASATLQREDDVDKKRIAQNYLEEQGIIGAREELEALGIDVANLSPEHRAQYAQPGLKERQSTLTDKIGETLKGNNLEGLLGEIAPQALEELTLAKELSRGGVKGYDEMLSNYQAYRSAMDLEERSKSGKLGDKDKDAIRANVVSVIAREFIDKKKAEGKYSDSSLSAMGEVFRVAAKIGDIKDEAIAKGVKSYVDESQKAWDEYVAKSGKSPINYVRESLKALRDDPDPADSQLARELIYSAAKRSASMKPTA